MTKLTITQLKKIIREAVREQIENQLLPAEKYELVYSTGGHGGPYEGMEMAKKAAEKLLNGGSDRWIAVVKAGDVSNLGKPVAKAILRRGKGWTEGGISTLPNVNPVASINAMDEAPGRSRRDPDGDSWNDSEDFSPSDGDTKKDRETGEVLVWSDDVRGWVDEDEWQQMNLSKRNHDDEEAALEENHPMSSLSAMNGQQMPEGKKPKKK